MEKWSYQYNADTDMKSKLEDIQFQNRIKTIKDTMDYIINKAHEEMIECTKSKNSTNN